MARVLHVDDEEEWREIVSRALRGKHRVDPAENYEEALELIRSSDCYDLAILDWRLEGRNDETVKELLEVLREECPDTARLVITGKAPPGSIRHGILDRYGVYDVIIKGDITAPDLQILVNQILGNGSDKKARAPSGTNGRQSRQAVRSEAAELRQRFRDWQAGVDEDIQSHIRDAQGAARRVGPRDAESTTAAKAVLDRWLSLHGRFVAGCLNLDRAIADAKTAEDVRTARDEFDSAAGKFAAEIDGLK
ncbi:MAG TPA: response regulator [Acidimicrobiales bacterium]